jgi:hypothetical protein
MRNHRVDFHSPIAIDRATETLVRTFNGLTPVSGDPFDRQVAKHVRLAEETPGTERGKKAFVASAEAKRRRNGPGVEFVGDYGNEPISIMICRNWAVATFDSELSPDSVAGIRGFFETLAPGELSEY